MTKVIAALLISTGLVFAPAAQAAPAPVPVTSLQDRVNKVIARENQKRLDRLDRLKSAPPDPRAELIDGANKIRAHFGLPPLP